MMRRFLSRLLAGAFLSALLAQAPALAQASAASPLSASVQIRGGLTDRASWDAYKARFVSETGRVVDTANGGISHSEGQGYGMLLAVAADDREAFERIWGWTRANLMVRGDSLLAWRWEPDKRPGVSDMNNATDGDILVAWALVEAAEAWGQKPHAIAARRIAVEIGRRLILGDTPHGPILLPGMTGFSAEDRADGPLVNLSYWVFPAFDRLGRAAPEFDWPALSRNGVDLLDQARFGPMKLPAEWTSLAGAEARPASGFPQVYGYNALRIPLYLAWSGITLDHPIEAKAAAGSSFNVVDLPSGQPGAGSQERGYAAITALVRCAAEGVPFPSELLKPRTDESYYPVTLHLLSLVALRTRHPACSGT